MATSSDIKVSICCATYNHEKYIAQALDSFLMQKTTFPFEVIVHDDASTDGTRAIIERYETKHPNIIKPIYQAENQYSKGVGIHITYLWPNAKGRYIAQCEGDDYWTDSYKLQKQIDFLESHSEYDLVHTDCDFLYDASGKLIHSFNKSRGIDYTTYNNPFHGILTGDYVIKTLTVVVCKSAVENALKRNIYKKQRLRGDLPLWLEIANHSGIGYLTDSTGVYRKRKGSLTHQEDRIKQLESQLDSKIIRVEFAERYNVPESIKRKVSNMYNRILLRKAYHTNNITLAREAYAAISGHKCLSEHLMLIAATYPIAKSIIEVARTIRKGIRELIVYFKKQQI